MGIGFARIVAAAALGVAAAASASAPARAGAASDAFKGRTVRVMIGVGVGGDYDVQARFLARHIGRHLPGNPAVMPENMVGAGGLKMANWLYGVAPKDGTVIGVIANNFPALQVSGGKGVQFDIAKFNWLGGLTRETDTMVVWHMTGVKTLADARETEVVAGASGKGAITYTFPAMMNAFLGTKFRIVTGYAGGNAINLAMERGEVGARINSWASWKVTHPDWIREKKIVVIAQGGRRSPELSDVPSVEALAKNDADRAVIKLLVSGASLGRPFAAPPGVPAGTVKALRAAFTAITNDPAALAEAKAARMDIDPMDGEEMQATMGELLKTPKALGERAREFLQ